MLTTHGVTQKTVATAHQRSRDAGTLESRCSSLGRSVQRHDDPESAQVRSQCLDVRLPTGEPDVAIRPHQVGASRSSPAAGGGRPRPLVQRQPGARGELAKRGGGRAVDVDLPVERRERGEVVGPLDPRQPVAGVDPPADPSLSGLSRYAIRTWETSRNCAGGRPRTARRAAG